MHQNERSIHNNPSPNDDGDDDGAGTLPTKQLPAGDPPTRPDPGGDIIAPGQPDVARSGNKGEGCMDSRREAVN